MVQHLIDAQLQEVTKVMNCIYLSWTAHSFPVLACLMAQLILVVKPLSTEAATSLDSEHNFNRLTTVYYEDDINGSSAIGIADGDQINGDLRECRECTPHVSHAPQLELHLGLDPGPRDYVSGFVFGTDKDKCDVQLLESSKANEPYGISRMHFRLDLHPESGLPRLHNMSRNGTWIVAPSVNRGKAQLQQGEMHALNPNEQTKLLVGALEFEVSTPYDGNGESSSYKRTVEKYLVKVNGAVPRIGGMSIDTVSTCTPNAQIRQGSKGRYRLGEIIGEGSFGRVCKATDILSGSVCAAKIFRKGIKYHPKKFTDGTKDYPEVVHSMKIRHVSDSLNKLCSDWRIRRSILLNS